MALVQKENRQLQIDEVQVPYYIEKGYVVIEESKEETQEPAEKKQRKNARK